MLRPERLVFVGGLHRSGTTPLARVVASHPGVSGLSETGVKEDEGQHVQRVYPKAKLYGGAGRFALDDRAHLTEASPLVSSTTAERLLEAWTPYWDLDKPLLLEKSPPNLVMGRFLQAVFPGSAMVIVLRHPVVVALSTQKWRRLASRNPLNRTSLSDLVRHWLRAHELLRQDLPFLARVHLLRYEDLVADPQSELVRIQRFLGLSEPIPSGGMNPSFSNPYEAQWEAMTVGTPWKRQRRAAIEERFGDQIAEYGYDVRDLRVTGPWSLT